MKRLTAFNLLPFPIMIGEFAWVHIQDATRKTLVDTDSQFYSLRVGGYRFDMVDGRTRLPVRDVVIEGASGHGLAGRGDYASGHSRLSAGWVGHTPFTVTIEAPGYRSTPIRGGDYPESYQTVKLMPLQVGAVPAAMAPSPIPRPALATVALAALGHQSPRE